MLVGRLLHVSVHNTSECVSCYIYEPCMAIALASFLGSSPAIVTY